MWSMSSIGLWNKSCVSRVNTLRKFSWIIELLDQVNYIISNPWPSHFIETCIQTIWAWTCIWSHIFNNVPNFLFVWNRGCIFILYWWCFLTIVLLWYLESSALRREQFVEVIVKHRSYLILSCDRRTIFLCQISYSVFGCSPYNCPVEKLVLVSPLIAQTFLTLCLWNSACFKRIWWCWWIRSFWRLWFWSGIGFS